MRGRDRGDAPVLGLRPAARLLRSWADGCPSPKAGAALRDDPVRLWQHVAEQLAGRFKDALTRTATALVLVAAAGSRVDDEQLAAVPTSAVRGARGGGPCTATRCGAAGHVDEVLDVMDAYQEGQSIRDAGRVLTRASLRAG